MSDIDWERQILIAFQADFNALNSIGTTPGAIVTIGSATSSTTFHGALDFTGTTITGLTVVQDNNNQTFTGITNVGIAIGETSNIGGPSSSVNLGGDVVVTGNLHLPSQLIVPPGADILSNLGGVLMLGQNEYVFKQQPLISPTPLSLSLAWTIITPPTIRLYKQGDFVTGKLNFAASNSIAGPLAITFTVVGGWPAGFAPGGINDQFGTVSLRPGNALPVLTYSVRFTPTTISIIIPTYVPGDVISTVGDANISYLTI